MAAVCFFLVGCMCTLNMHYLAMAFRIPVTPVQRGKDVQRPELSSPSVLFYNLSSFLDQPVCSSETKYINMLSFIKYTFNGDSKKLYKVSTGTARDLTSRQCQDKSR